MKLLKIARFYHTKNLPIQMRCKRLDFFEGSEKKLEVYVKDVDLRALGKEYWSGIVERCQAKILSSISNDYCDAYLLSESSLFVWKDSFTMITCGTTMLVNSVEAFLERFDRENISLLVYERKNEYRPQLQKTSFFDDVKRFEKFVDGKAYRFGNVDEHHLFLYEMNNPYEPEPTDNTFEVLMYDLQGEAKKIWSCPKATLEEIQTKTAVRNIIPGFQVDDFKFDPCGYSLNAINGPHYFTIHVTPEESGSYVSFETNFQPEKNDYSKILAGVLKVFQPRSFDTVLFAPRINYKILADGFTLRTAVQSSLASGFDVKYCHFSWPVESVQSAKLL